MATEKSAYRQQSTSNNGPSAEQRRAEDDLRERQAWLAGQRQAMEAALNGESLEESLSALVRTAKESVGPGTQAAFYLTKDEKTALHHVVGMPAEHGEEVASFRISGDSLACGLAIHRGKPVLTPDVTADPRWREWRHLAERFDYRACWSFPIHSSRGRCIGTLAIYSRQPREATERDLELASLLTHTAAIIIARHFEWETRQEAERALSGSEQSYRELVSQVVDYAIFRTDRQGHPVTWNEGVQRVLGFSEREFIGADIVPMIFTSEAIDAGIPQKEFDEAARFGTASNDRWMCRKSGERFFAQGVTNAIRNAQGEVVGFTKIMRDYTELKRATQALRDADRRKNEFLATLAHELRNPLAPIRTGLEVLRARKEDPAALERILPMMERQSEQLAALVDDLTDVSRITRGTFQLRRQRVELQEIVRSAVESSRPLIEKAQHELGVSVPQQPLMIVADPHRLAQVISNLLNNAAKYTLEPGRIELAAELEEDAVKLTVTDTGLGIEKDKLEDIFEMFSQVRSSHHLATGLGVGLTLTRQLVEMHGGKIAAHSAGPGQGSEFVVRLPNILDAPEPEQERRATDVESSTALRVLVVDDNRDAADSLRMLIEDLGHDIVVAENGREAIDVAAEYRPDIVLMDIGMPVLDGYRAARHLRQEAWGRDLFLVALTGWGQEADRRRTEQAGFDHHLVKPVDHATLKRLFAEVAAAE